MQIGKRAAANHHKLEVLPWRPFCKTILKGHEIIDEHVGIFPSLLSAKVKHIRRGVLKIGRKLRNVLRREWVKAHPHFAALKVPVEAARKIHLGRRIKQAASRKAKHAPNNVHVGIVLIVQARNQHGAPWVYERSKKRGAKKIGRKKTSRKFTRSTVEFGIERRGVNTMLEPLELLIGSKQHAFTNSNLQGHPNIKATRVHREPADDHSPFRGPAFGKYIVPSPVI
jgi:hypothetical protein